MKKIKYFILLLSIFISINSFAQNKTCSGPEFASNDTFFRATSNGTSMDITASKKKALSNARNSLINQIASKTEDAINKLGYEESDRKKMVELSMIAIRQEAANIKTICENCNKVNQKYESSVVVEMPKDKITKSIIAQITSNDTLKNRFDTVRFKNYLK